ncbi:MAG: tetratricopeptide repeat protein [Pseudomonadota bacterium]|nr:tetratricopeptide repeat protein [Pseudomonadota bacterium]
MQLFFLHTVNLINTHRKSLTYALGGIVLVLIAWYSYREYRMSQIQQASIAYYHLTHASNTDLYAHQKFVDHHPNTIFTVFSWMKMAQIYHEKHDFDKADESLQHATKLVSDPGLKSLLQLRMAKVALSAGKPQRAIDLLHSIHGSYLQNSRAMTESDALSKLHQYDQAYSLLLDLEKNIRAELSDKPSQEIFTFSQIIAAKKNQLQSFLPSY